MCGRYTLKTRRRIKVNSDLPFEPRYNIAPGQNVLVLADFGNGLELKYVVWGLVPSWSGDGKGFINARAETVAEKPSFEASFRSRRCLIPADGFFEWKRSGRAKQPFYFELTNSDPFAFAGIWDTYGYGEAAITSCAIITTTANELVSELHDRMPVILTIDSYDAWLDDKSSPGLLKTLLQPFPAERMTSHSVGSGVNYPEREGAELIKHVDVEVGTTPSLF